MLGLSACGDAVDSESLVLVGVEVDPSADTSANDGVLLLNAGAQDRLSLPVAFEVGDTATTTIAFELTIGFDGRSDGGGMEFEMTQTVTDVFADGATVELVVGDVRLTGNIAGDPGLERELEEIVDVALVSDITPGGTLTGEITRLDGGEVPAFFAEQMAQVETNVDFPTEPVGVGAVWTSTTEIESNGITIEAETRYDLIELTGDAYVVEITQVVPIDERIDGERLEGVLEGEGRLTVDRGNPLDADMIYDQSSELEADGMTFTIELDVTMQSD